MRSLVIAALLAGFAAPALALSCMKPDFDRAFQAAPESDAVFVVAVGRLMFDEADLPNRYAPQSTSGTRIDASFKARSLSRDGFKTALKGVITLDLQCMGPWCAQLASGQTYLAFLERRDGGYVLPVDPCYTTVFADPSPELLQRAQACMKNGRCP